MKKSDESQTRITVLALSVTAILVAAVGVSTAQVINTLAVDPSHNSQLSSDTPTDMGADLAVTLLSMNGEGPGTLILENVRESDLEFNQLDEQFLAGNSASAECGIACDLTPMTLQPGEQITVKLDTQAYYAHRSEIELVTMSGRVIDGRVVLTAD